MAESVIKLKAVCMVCFKDAAFTKRLGSETEVCPPSLLPLSASPPSLPLPQVEVIGGTDKYMAVCRTCYGLPEKPHLLPTSPIPSTSPDSTHTPPSRGGELTHGRQLLFDYDQYQ